MELVKKKFQDRFNLFRIIIKFSVPKAISCFLINTTLAKVSSELVRILYKVYIKIIFIKIGRIN